jgi:shikimate dehydrogenase
MATKKKSQHKTYGLIGRNISYSFSKEYFSEKFKSENIENTTYLNFDLNTINEFPEIFISTESIKGLNVTIPYKETIIPYLDKINSKATRIGAVNTIRLTKKGHLKGYNTDEYGFRKSILPLLENHHKKALILGTGGASKAIAFALKKLHIPYQFVSRKTDNNFDYNSLTETVIKEHQIIINCTPLGTHPNIDDCPNIPYYAISDKHLLYDLIYNPEETTFLRKGRENGAKTCNGLKMLELQAEKAWKIWNK